VEGASFCAWPASFPGAAVREAVERLGSMEVLQADDGVLALSLPDASRRLPADLRGGRLGGRGSASHKP